MKNINYLIEKMVAFDFEPKAIEIVNQLSNKKILKNPNFKTFEQGSSKIKIEDNFDKQYYFNEGTNIFNQKQNLPGIFEDKYFWCGGCVLKNFFRKNPNLINEFLAKQNLV